MVMRVRNSWEKKKKKQTKPNTDYNFLRNNEFVLRLYTNIITRMRCEIRKTKKKIQIGIMEFTVVRLLIELTSRSYLIYLYRF